MPTSKTKPNLSPIAARRLLKLADLLENEVSDNQFDLDLWFADHNKKKTGCGTVGYACGWAAQSPKFKGLTLEEDDTVWVTELDRYVPIYTIIDSKTGAEDLDAAQSYFRLNSMRDVEYLFLPSTYPTNRRGRRSVIARIRKYVVNDGDRFA